MVAPALHDLINSAATRKAPVPPGVDTVRARFWFNTLCSAVKISLAISSLNNSEPVGPI